jgi:hypothetical protein
MTTLNRILLFFLLPIIAILSFPPDRLNGGIEIFAVVAAFFLLIGIFYGAAIRLH